MHRMGAGAVKSGRVRGEGYALVASVGEDNGRRRARRRRGGPCHWNSMGRGQ